jgi:uncharacterized Zn finger protein
MGPWSRSFVSAVVGRAERPSDTALAEVHDLTIDIGLIRAQVGECTVTVSADPVPRRIWEAMTRFARGRGPLEEAVAGRIQSVHLEHLMAEDWEEPLIPRSRSITHGCSCHGADRCDHIVAVTYAFTDRVEGDPVVLLRWRGCIEDAPAIEARSVAREEQRSADPWGGGTLPEPGAVRVLAPGAVLKRLGRSEVRVDDQDLNDVLDVAYDQLGPPGADPR